jgi:hypothetical protein
LDEKKEKFLQLPLSPGDWMKKRESSYNCLSSGDWMKKGKVFTTVFISWRLDEKMKSF